MRTSIAKGTLVYGAAGRQFEMSTKGFINGLPDRPPVFKTSRTPCPMASKYLLWQCRAERKKGKIAEIRTSSCCLKRIHPRCSSIGSAIDGIATSAKSVAAVSGMPAQPV